MPILRLRRVGGRHEVSHGDTYVGDIDDAHLSDYCQSNLGVKLSVASIRDGGSNSLAVRVREVKESLMDRDPRLSPARAHLLATTKVLKAIPGLAALYRSDVKTLKGE